MSLSELLRSYPKASLELLAKRALLRRTDSKFLLRERDVVQMLEELRDDYALLYSGDSPIANYRTLYFDTEDLRCFHDHRRGRRSRHKVRVRHYDEREVSYLEVKTKRSERFTIKERAKRDFGDHELTAADLQFVASHCDVPAEDLRSQVWTNFRRVTLLALESSERVTIDTGLTVRRGDVESDLEGISIVEVKQQPFCVRTPVMQALRRAGHRPTSASKYCIGTAMTRDGLRLSRLRQMLKRVEGMKP
jgi:hypothetical protein